ncbi:MAG TPA: hypothetical protein VFA09_13850 [Ktedonobacteraceae bacterium]|nr:hypothetical protein [Ktedonobacteraceae bacterium]HZU68354.1 hypothetical protein [Ktedonobacteraceae bacterium]
MSNNVSRKTQELLPEQARPALLLRTSANIALSNAGLAEQCLLELGAYHRSEPCDQPFGLELFRRATVEGDLEAREWVQRCFGEIVLTWLRRHPSGATACRLESEENFIALTFERFWQATALTQQVSCKTLAAALQYLQASLHGAILDTLRAYSQPKESSLPEPGEAGAEDQTDSLAGWEILQTSLPHRRERRLTYLLYHCGLQPKEIVQFCPQEWSDVQEIYRIRSTILDRLTRNAN